MDILDRVSDTAYICGVELAFVGELSPSSIPDWQQFYNSKMINTDFSKTYVGLGSVSFNEESADSSAGTSYKQEVKIRFPSTDGNRSERLELMQRVKFIKLNLTNGRDIVIGRNDIEQNARPKINIKTNTHLAEAEFNTVSVFPSGYVALPIINSIYGLIPVILS